MKEAKLLIYIAALLVAIVLLAYNIEAMEFSDKNSSDFSQGTFINTSFNGTGVALFGSNLSGEYISKVFDSSYLARMENFSFFTEKSSKETLLSADANADVWLSEDLGINWALIKDDYNGGSGNGVTDIAGNSYEKVYILFNQDLYKAENSGASWTLVNDDFNGADGEAGQVIAINNIDEIYIIDGGEDVYKSIDLGNSFSLVNGSDFNLGDGNVLGMTSNSSGALFTVDAQAGVWWSIDGATWKQVNDDFNGAVGNGATDMASNGSALFILHGNDLWLSSDNGINWTLVNDDFNGADSSLGSVMSIYKNKIHIVDGSQDLYLSNDGGNSFTLQSSNYNGGNGAVNGIVAIENIPGISFQIRNCSMSCVNEPYLGPDNTSNSYFNNYSNLNREGRYFQYKVYFNSTQTYLSAALFNVSLNYRLVDTNNPVITIFSPENKTYGLDNVLLNYSVNDTSLIGECKYSLDGSINISLPGCTTSSISGLADGSHEIKVYANDSLGNNGQSSVYFSIDKSGPQYSNIQVSSPSSYSSANITRINVTWADASNVNPWIEINISGETNNYSMQNLGNGVFSYSSIFPAGVVYWRAYANDTFNNNNKTGLQQITIQKANNGARLYINGQENNMTIVYGNETNFTVESIDNTAIIYRNGQNIGNSELTILASDYYNLTSFFSGNQNYSEKIITFFLNVTKKDPSLNLLLNGFDSDIAINAFSEVSINASASEPLGKQVLLYEEEVLIDNSSYINLTRNYTSIGIYNFTVQILETQNYSGASKTHFVNVLDANSPHYSQLKARPSPPVSYLKDRIYRFNSTWVDDIGIEDISFEINNMNYSLGNLLFNMGDDYYIELEDFSAGNYQYRWHANDTSGNRVSTPLQNYVVDKAVAALFLTMTPGNSVSYGTNISVGCIANNPESEILLTRNMINMTNPDTETLAVGTYNYACTSNPTQNYTSDSKTGSLIVNKAFPNINFSLNDIEGNLILPAGGGTVNITANLSILFAAEEEILLLINGENISSGFESIEYSETFVTGSHNLSVYYAGNQNYSSYILTRTINVLEPVPSGDSGGSSPGSGGGSGGGSRGALFPINRSKDNIKLEFESLGDIIISPGESKILELIVKNTGNVFLNKCKLIGDDNYIDWIEAGSAKNINPGEISEYIFTLKTNLTANQDDKPKLYLECLERTTEVPLNIVILQSGMNVQINNMNLISKTDLSLNYTIIGNSDFSKELIFMVQDSDDKVLSEKSEMVEIKTGKNYLETILDVSDADKGLLKVSIIGSEGNVIVEEFFVYDSSQPITGLALFNGKERSSIYVILIISIFVLFAIAAVRRMHNVKKWHKENHASKIIPKDKAAKPAVKPQESPQPQKTIPRKISVDQLFGRDNREEFKLETYGRRTPKEWETY